MKSLKKLAASSAVTIAALVLAAGLLGYSTIGGARAALTYYSENYISEMQLQEIGVTLQENGVPVATGSALQTNSTVDDNTNNVTNNGRSGLLQYLRNGEEDKAANVEEFHLGVHYPEQLTVHNATGRNSQGGENITQYVRVTVTRYWEDKEHKKLAALDPGLIQLWLNGQPLSLEADAAPFAANNWLEDKGSRTAERMVLYYTLPLEADQVTLPFADTFAVDKAAGDAMLVVTEEHGEEKIYTRTYRYNNASFHLDIRVDAVQNHNAADAMLSAWGRTATFDENGVLTGIQ